MPSLDLEKAQKRPAHVHYRAVSVGSQTGVTADFCDAGGFVARLGAEAAI